MRKVDITSSEVIDTAWSTLYALEYHRLKSDNDKIAVALAWIGKNEVEIKEIVKKYNESIATLAAAYADEGVLALSNVQNS